MWTALLVVWVLLVCGGLWWEFRLFGFCIADCFSSRLHILCAYSQVWLAIWLVTYFAFALTYILYFVVIYMYIYPIS